MFAYFWDRDSRMHCTKDVSDYQSASPGAWIKLDVLALRSGADTVESNRTLDCRIDALDGDSDDALLVI